MKKIAIGNKTSAWTPSNEYYNSWKDMKHKIKQGKSLCKEVTVKEIRK